MNPEQSFHEHHERLIDQFEEHLEEAYRDPAESLSELVEYLKSDLIPHALAEEAELYAAVDRLDSGELSTADMRKDHEVLQDRIADLAESDGDPEGVRRKLDEFSGILLNHFRKEEELLIPLLAEKLSADEFESLLGRVHDSEKGLQESHGSDQ